MKNIINSATKGHSSQQDGRHGLNELL
uniref:Uncharacterized protein n=1 Tax=Arundo donax TaxID=35708 RepID=A0A0A8Z7M4_ARUDO